MALFNFSGKGRKEGITLTDREWVESCFLWLCEWIGFPDHEGKQYTFTKKTFPLTFQSKGKEVQGIINDLANILQLDPAVINYELLVDIRDTNWVPFETQGEIFEANTIRSNGSYSISIANSLLNNPSRLIFILSLELFKIKLLELEAFSDEEPDHRQLLYIAGIYFGLGVVILQQMYSNGESYELFWVEKWNYVEEVPREVMAYAMAVFITLFPEHSNTWRDNLPPEIYIPIEKSLKLIGDSPNFDFVNIELLPNVLFAESDFQYQQNQFGKALDASRRLLSYTEDEEWKSFTYNNIGYYLIRQEQFETALEYLQLALEINPDFGFANDNMGYALIRIGKLEDGKRFVLKAIDCEDNDFAYSSRNLALYYQAKGEYVLATEHFHLAFEHMTDSVDLLELHVGLFLLEQREVEEGMKYIKKGVDKGEPETIQKWIELTERGLEGN